MTQVRFVQFSEPRKVKCECCDRGRVVEVKMFISQDGKLVGDLDLCADCAEILLEVAAKQTIDQQWDFGGGEEVG